MNWNSLRLNLFTLRLSYIAFNKAYFIVAGQKK